MKAGRIRSLRGLLQVDADPIRHQLILDDGRINHGLKILSFNMWTTSGGNNAGIDATLSMAIIDGGGPTMDCSDNRQIAWTTGGFDNGIMTMSYRTFIDPDHVINRDLFITGLATDGPWNYLIICEEYDLSDDKGIIQILKETSQNI